MPAPVTFSFKCDVGGKFAHVTLRRGSISWQSARVSSTARLLVPGLPIGLVLGAAFGTFAWFVLGQSVFTHVIAVVLGLVVAYLGGYRLGSLAGNALFPTKNSALNELPSTSKTAITTRRAGRVFSFITVRSGATTVEFRVSSMYLNTLVEKLRETQH